MADHLRKQIRAAAVTALTSLTTTTTHVYSGRVSPLAETELPALLVFLNVDETTEGAYNSGATVDHSAMLRVEAVCKGNDEAVDTLDQIAAEVETALFANSAFLALLMVTPSPPTAQLSIDEPVEGLGLRLGSLTMVFPIMFRTRLGDPTTKV